MVLARGGAFLRRRLMLNAAGAAAVGHMTVVDDGVIVNDGFVHIGGANDGGVHIRDGGVIGKSATSPFATGETDAHVAEAVVDAAVVADGRSPVAFMEEELPAGPAPVGRSPEESWFGRRNPGAGDPEVAIGTVGPIAGSPDQVGLRARGLHIDRQHGGSKTNSDADRELRVARHGNGRHEERKQKPMRRTKPSHRKTSYLPITAFRSGEFISLAPRQVCFRLLRPLKNI
jgi:hypothetical protein